MYKIEDKRFPCACGWAFHSLCVQADVYREGEPPWLSISVVNAPADINLWQRIKAAWYVLIGREHVLSEIHVDNLNELVEFFCSLLHNPNTR